MTAVATAQRTTAGTALLTDQYELTMLRAALADGTAHHRAVFELFARRLPRGRRYGVVAGTGRFLDALADFRFHPDEIDWLLAADVIDQATAEYLADYRFHGRVDGYREGEIYFGGSPVLTIEATFGEAVILETLALSIFNHDTAIASAASRMTLAANGRPCIEMGTRRTHEHSATAAARAAYIAGFDATSNLAAGLQYGIPTRGTAAHAFTLAHTDERSAFASQVASLGHGTTLLVDTYDIHDGVANALAVAGTDLGAVRLDSGDLAAQSRAVRAQLDAAGAASTRILVTSDLDEHAIAALADAPVDGYGVGTRLVTGSGKPTAEMVYKLVAIADAPGPDAPLRPVAKRALGKPSHGGRKRAWRELDQNGTARRETVVVRHTDTPESFPGRPLQVPLVRDGIVVDPCDLEAARRHHQAARAELAPMDLLLTDGSPSITVDLPS